MTEHREYTVHVDGIGYVAGLNHPPFSPSVGTTEPDIFTDEDTAHQYAKKVLSEYRRLGLSNMSVRVRVHERIVTVSHGEWHDRSLETLRAQANSAVRRMFDGTLSD